MANRRSPEGRNEIRSESGDKAAEYERRAMDIDDRIRDMEIMRETQEALSREGSTEGVDAVDRSVVDARGRAVEDYEQTDQELDEQQNDGKQLESDLAERGDRVEEDAEKLGETKLQVKHGESGQELEAAEQAAEEDEAFFREVQEQLAAANEQSESQQQAQRSRVDGLRP